jgi:hypothetical protein
LKGLTKSNLELASIGNFYTANYCWMHFLHLIEVVNRTLDGCQRASIVGDFNVDLLKEDFTHGRYNAVLKSLNEKNPHRNNLSINLLKFKLLRIQTTGKYKNLLLTMSTQVTIEVFSNVGPYT